MERYKTVLTIAGSDSGGCAGIQADIKSISACGAFAASVITATTAQNTQGVIDIHPIPTPHLQSQLEAVLSDIHFDAVKIGMLHDAEVIQCVKSQLLVYSATNIVLDPVMISTSGHKLISDEAINELKALFEHVALITPNLPEAEVLLGQKIDQDRLEDAANTLAHRFGTSILLKGGHLSDTDTIIDTLYTLDDECVSITHPKIQTSNTHGTGCSLSSSIATFLALGHPLKEAVQMACDYIHQAIINGKDKTLSIDASKGHGPINHFNI